MYNRFLFSCTIALLWCSDTFKNNWPYLYSQPGKLLEDLTWSDPLPDGVNGVERSDRGSGILYGCDVTRNFLQRNKCKTIVRLDVHSLSRTNAEPTFSLKKGSDVNPNTLRDCMWSRLNLTPLIPCDTPCDTPWSWLEGATSVLMKV